MKKLYISLTFLICFCSVGFGKNLNSSSKQLHKLFEQELECSLREDPLFATFYGDHRFDDKLPQVSLNDIDRQAKQTAAFLGKLIEIKRNKLSAEDKINYDIFKRMLENSIEWNRLQSYLMPINQMGGFHTYFAQLPDDLTFNTVKDYENYIARLNAFKLFTQQHIELMRTGIKKGMIPPKIIIEKVPQSLESLIKEDVNESTLFEPFKKYPQNFSLLQQQQLTKCGRTAIKESVMPAYKQLLEFIKQEYIPAGRENISIYALPNGREYYKHCIRHYTTLDISPEKIFNLGQQEVQRIHNEMIQLIARTDFKGSLSEFKKYIQTDDRFKADSPESMLKDAAWIMKKTDGQLPTYFSRLPRKPVGIKKVPSYIESKAPLAYYSAPTMDCSKAGFYFVNTYNVKNKSLYNLTSTTLHETNPGHHLQIALQQELTDLPPFRRTAGFTAYVEGWALYAEKLGEEMGIYEDDYSKFGRLDNEIWRACRLVVDTGIHHFSWSRQKAIDYMLANTSLSKDDIAVEVDRYIVWPGQALSYKIGELKILELRRLAEKKLGSNFDICKFHDAILREGALPLDILHENVEQWIEENARKK